MTVKTPPPPALPEELDLFLKQLTTELITQVAPSPAATGAGRERIQ